ncbi:MAG: Gfo/Idh/MocA family oxidoreductase [Bdellovibrionaceae bacterium]|nr:Gfo/Idh/MocA family oxidoreductase [Bdellovibrionales bacterium]MCB9083097.1 Gfo/Idh/MocA family oxidoreductase [Pseudobdellovibrionaceae bacterium]
MTSVSLIGYGYWGRNIARVVSQSGRFRLLEICDIDPEARNQAAAIYPGVRLSDGFQLPDKEAEVVAIMTPVASHYDLAKRCLQDDRHVWLTKPMTMTLAEAADLVELAEKKNRTVFVDHTFIFNPAVRKMKELLPRIGEPYFLLSHRMNLGRYQEDVNVIYDLAPHDLSIMTYLFGQNVVSAETFTCAAAGLPQEDLAHANLVTDKGIKALVTWSWLSPFKVRQMFLIGSKGMLFYDDAEVTGKVKFFDREVTVEEMQDAHSAKALATRISYRSGDLYSPTIPTTEALALETEELDRALKDPETRHYYHHLSLQVMQGMDVILQPLNQAARPSKISATR